MVLSLMMDAPNLYTQSHNMVYIYNEDQRARQEERARTLVTIEIEDEMDGRAFDREQLELFHSTSNRALVELNDTSFLSTFGEVEEEVFLKLKMIMKYSNIINENRYTAVKRMFFRLMDREPTLDLYKNFKRFVMLFLLENQMRIGTPDETLNLSWAEFWGLYTDSKRLIKSYWHD